MRPLQRRASLLTVTCTHAPCSGLESFHKRAEDRRVGIGDAQFSRLLEASWLDLARSPLAEHLHPPQAVAECDLTRLVSRHQAGARRREGGVGVSELMHLSMSPQVRGDDLRACSCLQVCSCSAFNHASCKRACNRV